MKPVQINVEYGQLPEMATAFGLRLLGTALIVISRFYRLKGQVMQLLSFNYCQSIEIDYQSGSKQPQSKGAADLINEHAAIK